MTCKSRPPALRALVASLLVLGLALTGCGGDDKPKGTTVPPQPSTTPAVPTTANPTPPGTTSPAAPAQPNSQPGGGTGGTQAPTLPPGAPAQGGSDDKSPSQRYQEFCAANPTSCAN